MAKEDLIWIVIVILITGAFYFYYSPEQSLNDYSNNIQTTNGNLKREIPLEVNPGENFEIKYIVEPSPSFKVAAIEDTVLGGCTFSGGENVYKTIVFDSGEIVVKVTAPSSGSCTFSGEYGYADDENKELKSLPSQIIKIK